jgi:hypothetical protein
MRGAKRGIVVLLATGCVTGGLVGCSSHAPPSFELADVYTQGDGPDGRVVVFVVEGINDSTAQLPLRDVTYSVSLDGGEVVSARRTAEATLPAKGSQTFELPIGLADGQSVGGAYRLTGSVEYQLPGALADLMFDNNIRRTRAGFSFSGQLDAQ